MKKVTTVEQLEAHYQDDQVTIYHGDCLDVMASLPAESVHAIVTDPPYGLGFMGKKWDDLPPGLDFAVEAMRVLKPGGHLLAFGGSRTWHRLAVAVEDAGFEIRDSIAWLYGSGFPKSHNVGKMVDRTLGAVRPKDKKVTVDQGANTWKDRHGGQANHWVADAKAAGETHVYVANDEPITPEAAKWAGFGTALKPAFEPIVVARKPLTSTVAANVLEHGTGALNIDGCRVGATGGTTKGNPPKGESTGNYGDGINVACDIVDIGKGRWPTNVLLDDTQAAELDKQTGVVSGYQDESGASRFFPTFRYQAKAPKSERPEVNGIAHPTVKPLDLMRWLVRLVTPPGGTVLDPFAGSGTTGEACLLEDLNCILIEREEDYLPLVVQRVTKHLTVGIDLWGGEQND